MYFTNFNTNYINKKNFIISLIGLLPVGLIAGSLIGNFIVVSIASYFLYEIVKTKKLYLLYRDKNFKFLILINIYLIINAIFIAHNLESVFKSISFLRFIILAYAISYYFIFYKKIIIKLWVILFLIITFDIFFEFTFGNNIFGLSSNYYGRIASFTGDELKIGGYYFGFIFIVLTFFENRNQKLFFLFAIIFLIASLVTGERSNFLKIFIMYLIYFLFFFDMKFIKKIFFIFFITIVSLIIINNIPIIKSKFYNQIFKQFIIAKNEQTSLSLSKIVEGNQHLSHYKVAFEIFKLEPIFGSGFRSFRILSFEEKYQHPNMRLGSTHPHQIHFQFLSELGIVGYILILSNFIYVITRSSKLKKNSLYIAGKIFLIATLVPILPSGSFFTSYGATIFFINYSLLLNFDKLKISNNNL
jgi:O-antigen ligase